MLWNPFVRGRRLSGTIMCPCALFFFFCGGQTVYRLDLQPGKADAIKRSRRSLPRDVVRPAIADELAGTPARRRERRRVHAIANGLFCGDDGGADRSPHDQRRCSCDCSRAVNGMAGLDASERKGCADRQQSAATAAAARTAAAVSDSGVARTQQGERKATPHEHDA